MSAHKIQQWCLGGPLQTLSSKHLTEVAQTLIESIASLSPRRALFSLTSIVRSSLVKNIFWLLALVIDYAGCIKSIRSHNLTRSLSIASKEPLTAGPLLKLD